MADILRTVIVTVTLVLFIIILKEKYIIRFFYEAFLFLLMLLFLCIRCFFDFSHILWLICSVLFIIAAGNLLHYIKNKLLPVYWNITICGLCMIAVIISLSLAPVFNS